LLKTKKYHISTKHGNSNFLFTTPNVYHFDQRCNKTSIFKIYDVTAVGNTAIVYEQLY